VPRPGFKKKSLVFRKIALESTLPPHNAAKAVLEVLVRYFAVALARRGITVNTISPEDSVLNSLPDAFQTGLREWQERGWTPMGRLGTPADIGNAVALICSQEAAWITGQLIDVDGGASLVDARLPLEFQGISSLPCCPEVRIWSVCTLSNVFQSQDVIHRSGGEALARPRLCN
jgi:hypothetical protein